MTEIKLDDDIIEIIKKIKFNSLNYENAKTSQQDFNSTLKKLDDNTLTKFKHFFNKSLNCGFIGHNGRYDQYCYIQNLYAMCCFLYRSRLLKLNNDEIINYKIKFVINDIIKINTLDYIDYENYINKCGREYELMNLKYEKKANQTLIELKMKKNERMKELENEKNKKMKELENKSNDLKKEFNDDVVDIIKQKKGEDNILYKKAINFLYKTKVYDVGKFTSDEIKEYRKFTVKRYKELKNNLDEIERLKDEEEEKYEKLKNEEQEK